MSLVVVGLSHRTVPLDILERMTVSAEHLPKALGDMVSRDFVSEAVILSTCHRTEIYVVAERFHGGVQDIRHFLTGLAFLPPEDFSDHLFTYHDESAASHLFGVAAGLESVVLGESQILGQVRTAWERAARRGRGRVPAVGPVPPRPRGRQAGPFGDRHRPGRHLAVAGGRGPGHPSAGHASRGASWCCWARGRWARAWPTTWPPPPTRPPATGPRWWWPAAPVSGRSGWRRRWAPRWSTSTELPAALATADVLLSSTGSPTVVLGPADLIPIMAARAHQPLLIVDMGMPRDIDPAVRALPGVTLLDLADLQAFVEAGLDERRKEVSRVRAIVDEEVVRFQDAVAERQAAPLVTALRERADDLRRSELARYKNRLEGLDARQQEAVAALTHSILAKLLHEPTVRLKESAGSARGERLAEAIQELFDL